MQPQNTSSPTPPEEFSQSANSTGHAQYDFILNEQKQPAQSKLSFIKNIPKPALILLALGVVLVITLLIAALGGGSDKTHPLVRATGRAQEISRISALVESQSKDPDTQSLAATAKLVLSSEQNRITDYLKQSRVDVSAADLLVYQDKKTDGQLTQSIQDNKLEETYANYLKKNLEAYKKDLETTGRTVGKNGQALINILLRNVNTLLAAPQL